MKRKTVTVVSSNLEHVSLRAHAGERGSVAGPGPARGERRRLTPRPGAGPWSDGRFGETDYPVISYAALCLPPAADIIAERPETATRARRAAVPEHGVFSIREEDMTRSPGLAHGMRTSVG